MIFAFNRSVTGNRLVLVASLVCGLAACGKGGHESEAADAGAATESMVKTADAAVAPAMSAMAEAIEEAHDQPPNERRADRKATIEITKANYKSELTKLSKELGAP